MKRFLLATMLIGLSIPYASAASKFKGFWMGECEAKNLIGDGFLYVNDKGTGDMAFKDEKMIIKGKITLNDDNNFHIVPVTSSFDPEIVYSIHGHVKLMDDDMGMYGKVMKDGKHITDVSCAMSRV